MHDVSSEVHILPKRAGGCGLPKLAPLFPPSLFYNPDSMVKGDSRDCRIPGSKHNPYKSSTSEEYVCILRSSHVRCSTCKVSALHQVFGENRPFNFFWRPCLTLRLQVGHSPRPWPVLGVGSSVQMLEVLRIHCWKVAVDCSLWTGCYFSNWSCKEPEQSK